MVSRKQRGRNFHFKLLGGFEEGAWHLPQHLRVKRSNRHQLTAEMPFYTTPLGVDAAIFCGNTGLSYPTVSAIRETHVDRRHCPPCGSAVARETILIQTKIGIVGYLPVAFSSSILLLGRFCKKLLRLVCTADPICDGDSFWRFTIGSPGSTLQTMPSK